MGNEKDKTSNIIVNKLLYHNQFILGPFFIKEFILWKKIEISSSTYLTVHPDLNAYQAVYENKSITLLGFILDPDNPHATDSDIINGLIRELLSWDKFIEHTYRFGGRWILIVNDGKDTRLFHDATGLRQVFFTDTCFIKDLWCASQPGLIAEILNLQMDKDAVDFIKSFELKDKEYWWPGDSSSYKEIKHLLPNHYLNLETGSICRYWPERELRELFLDDAVEIISRILQGLMKSASNRFDLVLGLTAGWDSRLVLASSKEICNKVSYETVRQIGMPDDHPDIRIPFMLLSKLGLKHEIITSKHIVNNEFWEIFKKSSIFAHDVWVPDAQAIFEYYNHSKVAVTGTVSEVARCFYRSSKFDRHEATPQILSFYTNMGNNPFAVKSFEKWLSGIAEVYNYNILDLFYWEQRVGNWAAMCQLEFSLAWQDIFTPFNCRNLLINLLSVDEKYRRPTKYILYENLILKMWPEVLSVPINPHKKKRFNSLLKSYIKAQFSSFIPDSIKSSLKRILK